MNRADEGQDLEPVARWDEGARLDDYLRGLGDEEQAQGFEEELFARALSGEGAELRFRAGIAATLREMSSRGTLDVWLTTEQVHKLCASGKVQVLLYEYNPEQPAALEIPPGTDLVVSRIAVDLTGVRSLDAEVFSLDGRLIKRMPDINFNPVDGAVHACCEAELARLAGLQPTLTRVWVTDDAGRRVLAELGGY